MSLFPSELHPAARWAIRGKQIARVYRRNTMAGIPTPAPRDYGAIRRVAEIWDTGCVDSTELENVNVILANWERFAWVHTLFISAIEGAVINLGRGPPQRRGTSAIAARWASRAVFNLEGVVMQPDLVPKMLDTYLSIPSDWDGSAGLVLEPAEGEASSEAADDEGPVFF